MATVTKKKLINDIAQKNNINPADVRTVVQAFLDNITECLAEGDRLEFRDFGVFEVVLRKQKIGRNPKNASVPIIIPARNSVKFTSGKKMRILIEGSTKSDVMDKYATDTSKKLEEVGVKTW
ncbi:MAG: HU family DNA-binding protein [Waddliaceae bacterium]|jgi:integration host factor subunit beta|nr:HU family DNA-binding protein [Waddliaceae bacterium]MBT3578789.1 HU family DNA-binding protein [Waddliaceae bacterium]MBT4444457.1 HU family DNA-binding protein [Waddliaceae bacterium]MBT6928608.1 HU family DNA-binding protein [Waddliaceae bacterium]MBT7264813.1 HU family DNA-binding protein [Waddliaceae bacterium]